MRPPDVNILKFDSELIKTYISYLVRTTRFWRYDWKIK